MDSPVNIVRKTLAKQMMERLFVTVMDSRRKRQIRVITGGNKIHVTNVIE